MPTLGTEIAEADRRVAIPSCRASDTTLEEQWHAVPGWLRRALFLAGTGTPVAPPARPPRATCSLLEVDEPRAQHAVVGTQGVGRQRPFHPKVRQVPKPGVSRVHVAL